MRKMGSIQIDQALFYLGVRTVNNFNFQRLIT